MIEPRFFRNLRMNQERRLEMSGNASKIDSDVGHDVFLVVGAHEKIDAYRLGTDWVDVDIAHRQVVVALDRLPATLPRIRHRVARALDPSEEAVVTVLRCERGVRGIEDERQGRG